MLDRKNSGPVGRVVGLWRYPVKSMAAEPLAEVDVSWHGFSGDRRWAFIRNSVTHSGFPWLTLRERGDMGRYRPSFVDPAQPDRSATMVRTPSGDAFDVTDPALAAELCPRALDPRVHEVRAGGRQRLEPGRPQPRAQAVALGPVAGLDRLHAIIGRLHLGRNDLDATIEADRRWTAACRGRSL